MKFTWSLLFLNLLFFTTSTLAEGQLSKWIVQIYPADKPAPTVIVGHGCDGVSKHHHDWAKEIQSWGLNAVVMDSFTSRGAYRGTCNQSIVMPGERTSDVYEIASKIKDQPIHNGKFGYVGFSHGGTLALHLANDSANKDISAIVAYYPNCNRWVKAIGNSVFGEKRSFDNPRVPTTMFLAEGDTWTPPEKCLESVKDNNYEIQIYKDSNHGFDMNLPKRQAFGHTLWYNEEADKDSRKRTKDFFEKHLVNHLI